MSWAREKGEAARGGHAGCQCGERGRACIGREEGDGNSGVGAQSRMEKACWGLIVEQRDRVSRGAQEGTRG